MADEGGAVETAQSSQDGPGDDPVDDEQLELLAEQAADPDVEIGAGEDSGTA